MNKKHIYMIIGLLLTAGLLPAAGGNGGSIDGAGIQAVLESLEESPLSAAEREGILFMREEEKLARDVYNYLYETWNLPIFRNIARSEETHMDAAAFILDRYGLPDPVAKDVSGVFENPDLQALYDSLTTAGEESLEVALAVGAEIEDLDIYDLGRQLELTDNDDLRVVYINLEKGSRNHLRSFYAQILRRGSSYTPRHIDADYFNRIIESDGERSGVISDPDFTF